MTLAAPLRAAEFAYMANPGENNVWAYSIAKNGALTTIPGSPFTAGLFPISVAVDPTGKFLYVANQQDSTVSAYSIQKFNGALTPIRGSPFASGSSPISVAVDPTGKFVYVGNAGGGLHLCISAYRIRGDGGLTPLPGSPFDGGDSPSQVVVDPRCKVLYVANAFAFSNPDFPPLSVYSIGKDGALTILPSPRDASGFAFSSVAVDPRGQFLYETEWSNGGRIWEYRIGENGTLTPLPGSPVVTGRFAFSAAIDPSSKFLYVTSLSDFTGSPAASRVWGYSIGSDGALTPLPSSPFAAGPYPRCVKVDPTGKFVYVQNESDNTVWGYSLGRNGSLTPLPRSPFFAGFDRIGVGWGAAGSTSVAISRTEHNDDP